MEIITKGVSNPQHPANTSLRLELPIHPRTGRYCLTKRRMTMRMQREVLGLLKYRPDIDGLRAVAVLSVIGFHAFPAWFSGGFIGVDVFFVISGYLITTLILAEMRRESFSLLNFYERRARRILPALYFVVLCTLPFAWLTMVPIELIEYSKSLIAVPLFVSNIVFWLDAGYFQTASEFKPLLHTWSLAVEEQYYVLFPLFLMLAWKWCKKWVGSLLLTVAIVSVLAAQWGSIARPSFTFFMLPTRGFEILIGALVSWFLNPQDRTIPISQSVSQLASLVGLVLVLYALFAFDSSTPTPSFSTLVPTVGTGLVIAFANKNNIVGKLLAWKWFVGVGLISFSAYLWHLPLLVFARLISIDNPSAVTVLALCLLSLVAGWLSWYFVEKPFKNRNRVSGKTLLGWSLVLTSFFIIVGVIGVRNSGRKIDFCSLGDTSRNNISVAIFGDSHSIAILPVFDKIGKELSQKYTHIGLGGCLPLMGVDVARGSYAPKICENLAQREYDFIKSNGIKNVFLVGRWSLYTDGDKDGRGIFYLVTDNKSKTDKATTRINFQESLRATVEKYRELGVNVFVVAQIPQQNLNGASLYSKLYWRNILDKLKVIKSVSVSKAEHLALQAYNRTAIESVRTDTGFTFINLDDLFCDDQKCYIGDDTTSKYLDENHLSINGALSLYDVVKSYMPK